MSTFYIDLASLSNAIAEYENMIKKYGSLESMVSATTKALTENVWSGDDADTAREALNELTSETMPYAMNKLTAVKDALVDEKEELKGCKSFCFDLQNAFIPNPSSTQASGDSGIVKCDFDALSLSVDYGNNIIEECLEIKSSLIEIDSLSSDLRGSYDDLFNKVETFKKSVYGFDAIETHKSDLITYAGMVKDADDHLNTKLKEILGDEPGYETLYGGELPQDAMVSGVNPLKSSIELRSPEYIFCINAIENGSIDPSDLAAYNLCVEKILQSDECDAFLLYMKHRCYEIDADEWSDILTDTLLSTGAYVRTSGDQDWIDTYTELGFYLMDDLGIQVNPLAGKDERVGLSNPDFLKVTDSNGKVYYGGNQGWEPGTDIESSGCGLIAFNNVILYMSGISSLSQDKYMDYVHIWYDNNPIMDFDFNTIKVGMDPYSMCTYVEGWSIMEDRDKLTAEWLTYNCVDGKYQGRGPSLELIQEMLDKDIPVVLSYHSQMGTSFFVNTDLHYMGTEYGVSSHYVTVTGIVYNVNVSGEYTTMLEISNWGEKMYLDYSAYIEYVEDGLNDLDNSFKDVVFTQFGNGILYIH